MQGMIAERRLTSPTSIRWERSGSGCCNRTIRGQSSRSRRASLGLSWAVSRAAESFPSTLDRERSGHAADRRDSPRGRKDTSLFLGYLSLLRIACLFTEGEPCEFHPQDQPHSAGRRPPERITHLCCSKYQSSPCVPLKAWISALPGSRSPLRRTASLTLLRIRRFRDRTARRPFVRSDRVLDGCTVGGRNHGGTRSSNGRAPASPRKYRRILHGQTAGRER